jgi:plastocyanin
VLLFALSSGHKLGIGLMVAVFVGLSLLASMVVPRWRPQFPGRGLPLFLVFAVALFVAMLSAVIVFGRESKSATEAGGGGAAGNKIAVTEVEYKIELPKATLAPGTYTFDVSNKGKIVHNLHVQGGGADEATKDIQPGSSASVTVQLKAGTYDLYCSIPGHKQLGMDEKLTVS